MSRELLTVVEMVSNEKALDRSVIFEAMELALAQATRKKEGVDMDVRVDINTKNGSYDTFRRWTVVDLSQPNEDGEMLDELENPEAQIKLEDAQKQDKSLEAGDVIEESIESIDFAGFGRIAAQTAKNVIIQKVREAEREKMVRQFEDKMGEVILGQVKRTTRDFIMLDLSEKAEAVLPRDEMIPREAVRMGDRVKAVLKEVRRDIRGPQLILSRTAPEMLKALFKQEVPEVSEDVIEIKAIARDPGVRAKIAVKTNDGRMDPVGACVGIRGARVQAVSNELNGERVDVILWDDNPAQLAINAMSPAEVVSIVQDEESHSMEIAVVADQLSQAIGRNGQNVMLASKLTGWKIKVVSDEEAQARQEGEDTKTADLFIEALEVDEELAHLLVSEGFTSLEEVAYVSRDEMLEIEGFDDELAEALQERARNALLTKALGGAKPAEDLLNMKGMTPELAEKLAAQGITTMEELAEQSIDDIVDIEGLNNKLAGELIMTAREPWFAEDNK